VKSRSFEHESTPLHLASKEGHIEVVWFSVEHDAAAAAKDKHGWTPLHRASSSSNLDLAIIFMTMSIMAAAIRGTFV
jgi:ankyrin repeat protein